MKILRIWAVVVVVVLAGRAFHANAQTERVLYSFAGPPNGAFPEAGLVQGSDGNFYGTTLAGGTCTNCGFYGCGTVFRISPSGSYTTLYSFVGSLYDGYEAWSWLVQGRDGNFYGTASEGGTSTNCVYGCGTMFRISPSGTYTTLYSLGGPPNDGRWPFAGLAQGSDGNFYGTTWRGGTGTNCYDGCGTVFRISPSDTETTLYSFAGAPDDGAEALDGLVEGSDSNFYGTTAYGGTSTNCPTFGGCGTVFRISPSGSYTSLYSFGSTPNDGRVPIGGLVRASDGNFYGTTGEGGTSANCTNGCGTFFRISPSGTYTNLYSFDGDGPGGLVQGSDGNFYGTKGGGTSTNCHGGCGCVFRISPSGTYTTLYSFAGAPDDGRGETVLVQGSDGNLYGTTAYGGANDNGTVFELVVGGGCTYTLSAASVTLPAKGGSKNVSVKAKGSDCWWTAVSNDPFITITSGSAGTGNGKVNYTVPGNTNTTPLAGTMTIAGQTFTVNQVAGGCTFKLSPKTGKIKAAGGHGTVKMTPNFSDCAWTAVSNDSFISITAGASGVGNGTVSYTVSANTNTAVVTGSITIGGQTFTVTQSGAK